MTEGEASRTRTRAADIEAELLAMGVPEITSVTALAGRTQIPTATLFKALNTGVVVEEAMSGPRGERLARISSWADFFAQGKGAGVWDRSIARRAAKRRMTEEEFKAWYHGICAEGEIWVPFPEALGDGSLHGVYALSDLGRSKRLLAAQGTRPGTIVTPSLDANGYPQYVFKRPPSDEEKALARARGEKAKSYELPLKMHVAIATAFHPKPVGEVEVLHYGSSHDSGAHNLHWGTRKQNMMEVRALEGEANPNAMHTNEKIREVLRLKALGVKQAAIAMKLGIDAGTVSEVLSGKKWASVTGLTTEAPASDPSDE